MSKFKKKANVKQEIPTSSMPDVVFMLLFFFMVTTVLRDDSVMVSQKLPEASQMRKLESKNLVGYLFIGKPKDAAAYGSEPRIQANDVFVYPKDVIQWVNSEKAPLKPDEVNKWTVSMKVDSETKRGLIADVETELRNANARRLLYSTSPLLEQD